MRAVVKRMKAVLLPVCLLLGLLAGIGSNALSFLLNASHELVTIDPADLASGENEEERTEKEGKKDGEEKEEDPKCFTSDDIAAQLGLLEQMDPAHAGTSRDGFGTGLLRPPLMRA